MKSLQIFLPVLLLTTFHHIIIKPEFKAALPGNVESAETRYLIHPEKSEITWVARKTGGGHTGRLTIKRGFFHLNNGRIEAARVIADMRSISVMDVKRPKMIAKLTAHLNSDDFFSTENYPEAEFGLTSIEPLLNPGVGLPNYLVSGVITVKGIMQQVSFPATITFDKAQLKATAGLSLNRNDWNLKLKGFGDKLIKDPFSLIISIVAIADDSKL